MKIKLILRMDFPELGNTGEVVEVNAGYARNYLVPRGLAYPFSEDAMRRIEKASAEAEVHRAAVRSDMKAVADRLTGIQLTFEENANKGGHLYGAVTAKRIAEALSEHQLDIPEAHVRLSDPIRNIGEYAVAVHVHGDIDAEVQVWVVSATPAPAPAAEEAPAEATEATDGAESEEATS